MDRGQLQGQHRYLNTTETLQNKNKIEGNEKRNTKPITR